MGETIVYYTYSLCLSNIIEGLGKNLFGNRSILPPMHLTASSLKYRNKTSGKTSCFLIDKTQLKQI